MTSYPNFEFENKHQGKVAGVDEAGRGPLAGPVVAAAVILPRSNYPQGLNDSKKLTEKKRGVLYKELRACGAHIGIGIAEPHDIDRFNILGATMIAMRRAVYDLALTPDAVLIDGNRAPEISHHVETIVKGDAKSLSIAAASVIAKVSRDRLMQIAENRFPGYGLSGHKGYPTQAHRTFLQDLGASPLHRRSFAPVKMALTGVNKILKN